MLDYILLVIRGIGFGLQTHTHIVIFDWYSNNVHDPIKNPIVFIIPNLYLEGIED